MATHVRSIIAAGSVHPLDVEFTSPIQCKSRRHNRRCQGKIKITPRNEKIEYRCSDCESCGTIADWRGGDWDLSRFVVSSPDEDVLVLRMSEEEYKALLKVTLISGEEEALIAGAIWDGNEVVMSGAYEVFDELAGNVAFEANHTTPGSVKQMTLDRLCDRIERLVGG